MVKPEYLIIMAVRNEENNIQNTLSSIVEQTCKPIEVIIVDDASTDGTKKIVKEFIKSYKWIRLFELSDHDQLPTWQAVLNAFNYGYSRRITQTPDYLVKLDGDLKFPPDFFEKCFLEFEKNPRLGITGGLVKTHYKNGWRIDKVPFHHVRGATKVYRWECWEDIGGVVYRHGWDGIDLLQAQLFGWVTYHLRDNIALHYRPTGKRQGAIKARNMLGHTYYYLGSLPIFVILVGIRRLFSYPYVFGGISIIIGFFDAMIRREEQAQDKQLIEINRKQQLQRLLPFVKSTGGKGL